MCAGPENSFLIYAVLQVGNSSFAAMAGLHMVTKVYFSVVFLFYMYRFVSLTHEAWTLLYPDG